MAEVKNTESKVVKIEESKLIKLIARSEELRALDYGGVDNWSYWSESRADYKQEKATQLGLEDDDIDFEDIARAKLKDYVVED